MTMSTTTTDSRPPSPDAGDARWLQLAIDYERLPVLSSSIRDVGVSLRDVGALLMLGHDATLAEAERYVGEGHTMRTGEIVECDDVDDARALDRWTRILDRASAEGLAPPVPEGFWASFLRWRTPMGMIRSMSSSRIRVA